MMNWSRSRNVRPYNMKRPLAATWAARSYAPLQAWFGAFFTLWLAQIGQAIPRMEHPWWLWAGLGFRSIAGTVAPLGGGALSASYLVFNHGADVEGARTLGFALQSVGMTSAATYLLCTSRIDWPAVGWAVLGFLDGAPLGIDLFAKGGATMIGLSLQAGLWTGFGALLLFRGRRIALADGSRDSGERGIWEFVAGFSGGLALFPLAGGCSAVPLYLVLIFRRRVRLRSAVASCVLLMTLSAFLGLATDSTNGGLEAQLGLWVASAPLACFGPPLGLLFMTRRSATPVLSVLAAACVAHGLWVLWALKEFLGAPGFSAVAMTLVVPIVAARWAERSALISDILAQRY